MSILRLRDLHASIGRATAALVLAAAATLLLAAPPVHAQNPPSRPPIAPAPAPADKPPLVAKPGAGAAQPTAEPPLDPSKLPAVVARVNGTDVSREDLITEAKGAYQQLRQMGGSPDLTPSFYRVALDQRIASILIEKEAEARGFAATAEEIDQRMADMRSRFKSDQEFTQSLAATGMTVEKARAQLAQDISRYNYMEKVILPQVKIPDQAVKDFYDQNLQRMQQPERIKVRQILILVPRDATEDQRKQARSRADAALTRAKGGEDFAAIASELSDDESTRQKGGELPWIARGDLRGLPTFEEAAFALQKGALSGVVESPAGFHVIQCLDRQASRLAAFDEVKDRILSVLQNQAAQEKLRTTVNDLMAKAKIERFGL